MMAEDLFEDEDHRVETFHPRHFQKTVEIWCPNLDETKVILGDRYVRYCPMCGNKIE